jgi:hypothetical protein
MPAPRAVLKQGVGVQERQAAVNPARIRLALTEDVSVTLFAK